MKYVPDLQHHSDDRGICHRLLLSREGVPIARDRGAPTVWLFDVHLQRFPEHEVGRRNSRQVHGAPEGVLAGLVLRNPDFGVAGDRFAEFVVSLKWWKVYT